MSEGAQLQVPSVGFQGQMWDEVRSNDDLAPLRKKLSMHEFRLLFEAIEPVFKDSENRISQLESVLQNAAEYHRGYVEKLKLTDPDRSARQQARVDYFMGFIGNIKTCEWSLIEEDGDYMSGCANNDYVQRYDFCPDCGCKTTRSDQLWQPPRG